MDLEAKFALGASNHTYRRIDAEYSGFKVIFRDEDRSQEETVQLAEKIFGISCEGEKSYE